LVKGVRNVLTDRNINLLADSGYPSSCLNLITPNSNLSLEWNNTQKGLRSGVETVIGFVKNFQAAALTFRQNPELQELAVLCCYQLSNMYLKIYPMRHVEYSIDLTV